MANVPDDFDQLRMKWRDSLNGGSEYDPADPHIAARMADITSAARGYWYAMERSAARTFLWSEASDVISIAAHKYDTYRRLEAMALAYNTKGSELEGKVDLKLDILHALDWLTNRVYNDTMTEEARWWWYWEIGVPQRLLNITVLMHKELSAGQIADYTNGIRKFVTINKLLRNVGANRVWLAGIIGLMGVLTKNSQMMAGARDALGNVFLYVDTGDGFYKDGSFIQHNHIAYNGGYGRALLEVLSSLVCWLESSPWEVTDPNLANMFRWVYDAYEPFMYKGLLMDMVRGREITRNHSTDHMAGHGIITAVMNISRFAPAADEAAFRSMAKAWILQDTYRDYFRYASVTDILQAKAIIDDPGVSQRIHLPSYRQYACMDRAVQVRPDYSFGLSLSSDRISTHEAFSGENQRGWYTGEGMTYLYNDDISQYSDDFWQTVDPYRLPGTTVDTQIRTEGTGSGYRHDQREAGGTEILGVYGTSAMKVKAQGSSLIAKKSWFAFDGEIAMLGAGITSTDSRTIETTVENRKLAGDGKHVLTVNGTAKSAGIGWNETMSGVNTVHLSGRATGSDIGYYFPRGATLHGLCELRTGSWRDIDKRFTAPTDQVTRPYLTLWLDHGINPTDGTYEYVMLPNKTYVQVEEYANKPDISILENSPDAQAVRHNALNITGIQFWNDAVKTVGNVTSNKRAAVMIHETENELTVSVSDPSQKNMGTIQLEIGKKAMLINDLDPGVTMKRLSPTIQLVVHTDGSKGKTYHAIFSLT